ncbi:sec1 family protein [Stylonychia lemnae]|uniref:Sec1 family protein n=1 Tax=Stylonychia lemnae TaxID=5949 RepID=A0A077ZQ47_STYLE|nr:sec1 family protein [Stylonychia lemnae]|eukprot:CDW72057.1 sec1 family protein [Stylonychia lemnae]
MDQHNSFEFFEDEDEDHRIDLLETQKKIFQSIFNLTSNADLSEDDELEIELSNGLRMDKRILTFKVLVFDNIASNILANIMKVGALRDCNITLHMSINSKREQIPDIPAIYLIYEPQEAIFKKIAEDSINGIYDYFFVNFMKPISAELLDQFAIEMVKANTAHKICQVQYNYLGYQALSQNCFTLPNGRDNFKGIYTGKDSLFEEAINHSASGLLSLFKSIGKIPIVRVINGEISDKVYKRLNLIYQQAESDDKTKTGNKQDRPLLIILDRNLDLHTMLYHSWTYISLIEDIYGIKNNQFQHYDETTKAMLTYDIDFQSDEILRENAFKEFGEAAPNVDKALNSWKEEYDQISRKTNPGQVHDISQNLTSAMDQIPQMTERKKKIDMHINVASKILEDIKRRGIDKLQDVEDEIMTSKQMSNATKNIFMEFMRKDTQKQDEFEDKMRLLLIYIICSSDLTDIKQILDTLKTIHNDQFDEEFVQGLLKKRKDFENIVGSGSLQNQQPTQSFISGLAKQVTKGSKSLISNLANLMAEQKNLIHYNLVKKVIQNVQSKTVVQSESYYDIKTGEKSQQFKAQLKNVIVYVVGGGSYYEYECMKRLEDETKIQIIYGSDYIFQPLEFYQELHKLSK